MPRENAFEIATSSIRFGAGVTREVGLDLLEMQVRKAMVLTDPRLAALPPVATVQQSLSDAGIAFTLFDRVRVEPTDASFQEAIDAAVQGGFDAFVAVGGGSTIDTAKVADLYSTWPVPDFLDYVNPPIGRGLPVPGPLKPLIAIPTTAGTGSETTGTAIFDLTKLHAKTGIAHRRLRPMLGLLDPENTRSMPRLVAVASGFDVLSHAIESYTAMLIAASYAGVGFGNAGVHLHHGMSYPVSGMVRDFHPEGWSHDHPIVPHGMSVILNAPSVFRFTAEACPERHLVAAEILGADAPRARPEDAGAVLSDRIVELMQRLGVPNGLEGVGYTRSDVPALVQGTLPQERVTRLAPRPVGEAELTRLFEDSLIAW